jgi:elongation factor P
VITSNEFKTGMTIRFKDQVHEILDFQHVKPGKGGAFVRTKLKNLETGKIYENTFRAAEKSEQVIMNTVKMQFLYREQDSLIMMDVETYEQSPIAAALVGNPIKFLKEGMEVSVVSGEDKVLAVAIPFTVELEITQCDPGVVGDRAQGGTKPATVETGAVVQVPLFVQQNEMIRVDTRTGEYLERA